MSTLRRILTLVAIAAVVGTAVNAVSPRGISWKAPLGKGLRSEIAEAGLVPVELESVKALLAEKRVVFVDARPLDEYKTGRLPGAIRFDALPKILDRDLPIVVYCANEFCESALSLARGLRKTYSNVGVLVDGYDAWWNAGGPVDQD